MPAPLLRVGDFVGVVERLEHGLGNRKINAGENRQARQCEYEMKRQRDHARQVVQVQCAASRLLARTEREEFTKDPPMHHHAAHQRNQHHQRRQADDPVPQIHPVQVQAEMHGVEEVAADLQLVVRQCRARPRVERDIAVHVIVGVLRVVRDRELGEHREHRVTMGGVGAPVFDRHGDGQRTAHGACAPPRVLPRPASSA